MIKVNTKFTSLQEQIVKDTLSDEYDTIVVCTGRQLGKTYTLMRVALKWLISGSRIGFFEPTYKQCRKVFKDFYPLKKIPGIKFNSSTLEIELGNGVIRFHTAENDNCRGFTYDKVLVDEACFVKGDIFQEAILATVSVALSEGKGKLLLFSTPKYRNWFYDYTILDDSKVKVIKATSEEGGLISKEVLNRFKKTMSEQAYRNEFLGEFIDEGEGLFNYRGKLIHEIKTIRGTRLVGGIDWGMEDDYTVLSIINELGELVFIKRWRQTEWTKVIDEIVSIAKTNKVNLFSESNGVGQMPTQELIKKYNKTTKWVTSNKSKNQIIEAMIVGIENDTLKLWDTSWLKDELDAFGANYNPKTNTLSYSSRKGHDDAIMSIAIANYNLRNVNSLRVWN